MKYWTTLKKTYDALWQWSQKSMSSGRDGGLSPVYPRVWGFRLRLTKPFIDEIAAKTDETQDSMQVLQNMVIDEYLNRLRVHRWLASDSGSRYDWIDVNKSRGTYWNFGKTEHHTGCELWSYSTKFMTSCDLKLSCSWEWDQAKNRGYLQLILWLDHWRESKESRFREIFFKIPLEPGRLCDLRGELLYAPGQLDREVKASDLEVFPDDEGSWQSDEDKAELWMWYLYMKTFHSYL